MSCFMNKVGFCLSSSECYGFETPRACSIVRDVDIPVFSGEGLLVEIVPPIIGQSYGFGGDDIHQVVLTPRFGGDSLSTNHEWPCHVHILCLSLIANGDGHSDPDNILHVAWAEIYSMENDCRAVHLDTVDAG